MTFEDIKHGLDGLSLGALLGWLFGVLPKVATVLTVVWMAIRIWETDTIKKLTGRT